MDPLPNQVFRTLDMCRGSHVIGLFDACIIVVVKDSRGVDIWESVASFGNTAREFAKVDNLFQSGAGYAKRVFKNLNFGGTVLSYSSVSEEEEK